MSAALREIAMDACREVGEHLGEMEREIYYDCPSRNEDAEYLLPRIETMLAYTDVLAADVEAFIVQVEDMEHANGILSDTVDVLIEALLDALEVRRG